jgi:DNA polymerase/3'-5' exonuclease PolX
MEPPLPERLNEDIAGRLEEVAQLLATQGASRFRVRAYQRAAETVRRLVPPQRP